MDDKLTTYTSGKDHKTMIFVIDIIYNNILIMTVHNSGITHVP